MCPQYGGSCSGPALNHAGHNNFIINRGLLDLGWISNWWRRGESNFHYKWRFLRHFHGPIFCDAPKSDPKSLLLTLGVTFTDARKPNAIRC